MYYTKVLENCGPKFTVYQSSWLVPETTCFDELTICERAVLKAPDGKFLTLTVDGIGKEILPGTYKGDVVLSVTDAYDMKPGGLMRFNQIGRELNAAIQIKDGKVVKTVPEIINGGNVQDGSTTGIYIASSEESFNGIVIGGSGAYTVQNAKMDFEGFSDNDFLGVGCAVAAVDDAEVTIDHCDFTFCGVTRCAVHVGGHSNVTVKNTKIINLSPDSDWTNTFSWQVGFSGTNRLAQLTDAAKVVYDNCDLKTNGWGILSIDGSIEPVSMIVKNSRLELSGPRAHGYGAFCIGDNEIIFDNCDVDVTGYPMLLMGEEGEGKASILNSHIKGRRFGAMVVSDDNSIFTIRNTEFDTDKSTLCIKGSATKIIMDQVSAKAGNGTIVQLMDSDEGGMASQAFHVPVGVVDIADEHRDLAAVSETEDVVIDISNSKLTGNFFNSTTNIRACANSEKGGMGRFHDTVIGIMKKFEEGTVGDANRAEVWGRHNGDDLRGAKNLGLTLSGTEIEGIISSASQHYREGLTTIYADNRQELSNVTQQAAATVNNGVSVKLDGTSVWTVTGTSYITALELDDGAVVKPLDGKELHVTIDGKPVELKSGVRYTGKIVLEVK